LNKKAILKEKKSQTFILFWILLALLILLVTATYTWFGLTSVPRVNDMAIHAVASTGLEIATSYNGEYGQVIDFAQVVSETYPLKPATWSSQTDSLYAVTYGRDGRMRDDYKLLYDNLNSNTFTNNGYYVKGTIYARTMTPCKMRLSEAVEVDGGISGAGTYVVGTPVWDSNVGGNVDGGQGAQESIRVGLRITPINTETGVEQSNGSEFFIYEPNCDVHIDGTTGYTETENMNGGIGLIDAGHIIRQTESSWINAAPALRSVTIKTLGQFLDDTTLYDFTAPGCVKIDIYVWLEGQDVDCDNTIEKAQIIANMQFGVDYGTNSGYDVIPS